MPSLRSTLVVLGSTALMGSLATPAFAQEATYPSDGTPTATQGQTQKKGKRGKRRGGRLTDAQLTQVAEALGTTLEALKAAQAEVKSETAATDERETRAERDALLAGKLGVTVAELRAAFDGVRPARGERGERRGGGPGGCRGGATGSSPDTGAEDPAGTDPSGT